MKTKVLAAITAVLLMASARAEGVAAQPEAPPGRGAQAPGERPSPAAGPSHKHAKKQRKLRGSHEPEAKVRGAPQEKAKPCDEVKPCAIE